MMTRCTSASGTPLARAWAATISAYSASPANAACGNISPAATSAAIRKIFIELFLGRTDLHPCALGRGNTAMMWRNAASGDFRGAVVFTTQTQVRIALGDVRYATAGLSIRAFAQKSLFKIRENVHDPSRHRRHPQAEPLCAMWGTDPV